MKKEHMVKLACNECKHTNYYTRRNKKTIEKKLEFRKFCPWCQKTTPHKEAKK